MGIGVRHTILFLIAMLSVFTCLPHANGCGGVCVVGGGSSYDFLDGPSVNMDMSSFDEFVRDDIGNHQTTLSAKSLSQDALLNSTSSLNQTSNDNANQNSTAVRPVINSLENTTSNNRTVKLGASGIQDKRLSTLVFATFNNNMF